MWLRGRTYPIYASSTDSGKWRQPQCAPILAASPEVSGGRYCSILRAIEEGNLLELDNIAT
jgi:hypothetical protein